MNLSNGKKSELFSWMNCPTCAGIQQYATILWRLCSERVEFDLSTNCKYKYYIALLRRLKNEIATTKENHRITTFEYTVFTFSVLTLFCIFAKKKSQQCKPNNEKYAYNASLLILHCGWLLLAPVAFEKSKIPNKIRVNSKKLPL